MTIKENKPLLVNLIYMAVLIITFIYKYAIKDYDELFRIGLDGEILPVQENVRQNILMILLRIENL